MEPPKLLDTHIHLWPSTSVSPTNHAWMTEGHFLAKRHGISDYKDVTSASPIRPSGFIYVETDRYLPGPIPDISDEEISAIPNKDVRRTALEKLTKWAHEPLSELKFLRRIVEGESSDGDGFQSTDGEKMVGCVVWAPFHLSTERFDLYLQIAEEVSGPKLWNRIVGFRYLYQGIRDEDVLRKLLLSQNWLENLLRLRSGRNGRGWTFDIGVDAHRGGVFQLEVTADMVEKIREMEGDWGNENGKVRFILNHLCKPDLSGMSWDAERSRWLHAMQRLAAFPAVYMKLSGAFNEFAPSPTPSDIPGLMERLDFYTRNVFELFGPRRVMFGSDWPVCNIGGPVGENHNWELWREVVAHWLKINKFGPEDSENVWWKTGCKVYGVEFSQ